MGERGGEAGGDEAVAQLARQVGAHGQPAVPDEGQHLAVDAHPGPAQHEGRHGHPLGPRPGEGGHPGGQLQQTGHQPPGPLLPHAEQGQHPGQAGQCPVGGQQLQHHGEEHHKGADAQRGLEGLAHRPGEGGAGPDGLKGGPGGTALPALVPAPVEAEEDAHQDGGGGMGQVEQQPHPAGAEHPRPHHPQDEGGP